MPLTYNPNLAQVKVNPRAKNQGCRLNGSSGRAITDGQMDGQTDATKRIISRPSQSIKITKSIGQSLFFFHLCKMKKISMMQIFQILG